MASLRHMAKCPCCGIKLISPKRSECVSADKITNSWCCPICGKKFQTTDKGVEQMQNDAQLIRDFYQIGLSGDLDCLYPASVQCRNETSPPVSSISIIQDI